MCTGGGGDKTLHDMAHGLEMMTRLGSHHNDLKNLERKNGLRTSGKRDVTLFQKPLKVNQSKLEEKTEEIDGEHAEGEESESELERSQSFHSGTNDTIASQFMTEEYLEWPAIDWTSSRDRAQLSAYMKIYEYGKRQAKTLAMATIGWPNGVRNSATSIERMHELDP